MLTIYLTTSKSWKLQDPPITEEYQDRDSKKLFGNTFTDSSEFGIRKRGFSKKFDDWWHDGVQDVVESKNRLIRL